jgi:hypothetical protein
LPGVYAASPSRSAATEEEIAVEECGARLDKRRGSRCERLG